MCLDVGRPAIAFQRHSAALAHITGRERDVFLCRPLSGQSVDAVVVIRGGRVKGNLRAMRPYSVRFFLPSLASAIVAGFAIV